MVPTPTAELLLILAALRQYAGEDTEACSTFLHGMRGRLRSPKAPRRVIALRELAPEIEVAQSAAEDAISALCFVCEKRMQCERPLAPVMPLPRGSVQAPA